MDSGLVVAGVSVIASAAALFVALRKQTPILLGAPVQDDGALRAQLAGALAEVATLTARLAEAEAASKLADRKMGADVLAAYADQAVAAAEQLGGSGPDKLRMALDALRALDAGDNGRRDWTDAQHRIAIEAALTRAQ